MASTTYDAAVIGAGMLGAAVAYHLARRGQRVVVLEAATPAVGATGNSFSWLNAVSKEPEEYHRLNAQGVAEYAALADLLGRDFRRGGGCLEWAADEEGTRALTAKVERLSGRGYRARMIAGTAARRLEPGLRVKPSARVAHYEADCWVDAPDVACALLEAARELGAEVQEHTPVTAISHNGSRALALEGGTDLIPAAQVVVCAGIGTPGLLRPLGATLTVERRPGLLAVTTPVPPRTLSRVVYAPGLHLRPDVSGGLRLGADDVDALVADDASAESMARGGDVLLHRAAGVLGLALPADVAVARTLLGVRPVPGDGLTVAGKLADWDNVYVVSTHSGITLGPLLGRLVAEEMVEGRRDPLLLAFRPERFGGE